MGVFYPFCVAGWISISYPADLLLSTLTQVILTPSQTGTALDLQSLLPQHIMY